MQIGDETVRVPYGGLRLLFKLGGREATLIRHECNPINGPCPMPRYYFVNDGPAESIEDAVLLAVRHARP